MGTARAFLLALSATFIAAAASAKTSDNGGWLAARPSAAPLTLAVGETRLANGSLVYRPPNLPTGARPLLVILHGFGQDPTNFLRSFTHWADRCGAILIGPVAQHVTWDIIARSRDLDNRVTRPSVAPKKFGQDARRIDRDLALLFADAPIDPDRVALLGFSDGASYALSLGLANPRLFPSIIAFSPGFALWPDRVALRQKVFIAHGTKDTRLAFANTRDGIVKPLQETGVDVQFRQFEGDHVLVRPIVQESLTLAFGC